MTKEEAIKALRELNGTLAGDVEVDHMEADKILCELLIELGHADVVKAYKRIWKWYA